LPAGLGSSLRVTLADRHEVPDVRRCSLLADAVLVVYVVER
jgi:hypothetical protein